MSVDTRDELCPYRPCYRIGMDHGSFTQGVGYTTYHERSRKVCMERHLHGCPVEIPDPIPERVRCCHAPRVRPVTGKLPVTQRCLNCFKWLNGYALQVTREGLLPVLFPCKHLAMRGDRIIGWFRCDSCLGYFRNKPTLWEKPVPDEYYWAAFKEAYGK